MRPVPPLVMAFQGGGEDQHPGSGVAEHLERHVSPPREGPGPGMDFVSQGSVGVAVSGDSSGVEQEVVMGRSRKSAGPSGIVVPLAPGSTPRSRRVSAGAVPFSRRKKWLPGGVMYGVHHSGRIPPSRRRRMMSTGNKGAGLNDLAEDGCSFPESRGRRGQRARQRSPEGAREAGRIHTGSSGSPPSDRTAIPRCGPAPSGCGSGDPSRGFTSSRRERSRLFRLPPPCSGSDARGGGGGAYSPDPVHPLALGTPTTMASAPRPVLGMDRLVTLPAPGEAGLRDRRGSARPACR